MTARKRKGEVRDYRYEEESRKHIPEAGLAKYEQTKEKRTKYKYDPYLDPQLVWTGKEERSEIDVDLVSLHVHERISTKAILDAVKREEPRQLSFFADPQLPLHERIEFYQHDVDWSNRLILGDSLLVMNSLLQREGMGNKVQMIYLDPPYGISYSSNFQPSVHQRDVKDDDKSLTREVEQVKAYRDTWKLGIHSYLTYLRDRLLLCRELLTDSGSIFVQMGDENLHLVRCMMDEVFGRENFINIIAFRTTTGQAAKLLPVMNDYLLWYARDKEQVKYRQLYWDKELSELVSYNYLESPDDQEIRRLTKEEMDNPTLIPMGWKLFQASDLRSKGWTETGSKSYSFGERTFSPGTKYHWKTTQEGLNRLAQSERLLVVGNTLYYKRYIQDFPIYPINNLWADVGVGGEERVYAVQTNIKVIERCIQMTTDPGDLVFDPTCGSGTAAYCAEKWGRRWITCDTSRVALFLARQRLMTATFPYFELKHPEQGIKGGFDYQTVPHITLESITKNQELDPDKVEARRERIQKENPSLSREEIEQKLRKEIDELIRGNAPQETLYDKPKEIKGVVRVSGPFTAEAIPVPVVTDPEEALVGLIGAEGHPADPTKEYIDQMIELLRKDGIIFGGKKVTLEKLQPIKSSSLHAEAEITQDEKPIRVAVYFGPPYGPITTKQVEEAISHAQWEYGLLVLAGFSFDPEAQAFIQKNLHPRLRMELAHIRPDVLTGDLLKATPGGQFFTVFGEPDVEPRQNSDGTYQVELKGVDIYDPIKSEVKSSRAEEVAAWFLDTDYDGYCFHVSQAFFPGDNRAWEKLQRALKGTIDPEQFESLRGTVSPPFLPGNHKRIAVKVIDIYGNEVIHVRGIGKD